MLLPQCLLKAAYFGPSGKSTNRRKGFVQESRAWRPTPSLRVAVLGTPAASCPDKEPVQSLCIHNPSWKILSLAICSAV